MWVNVDRAQVRTLVDTAHHLLGQGLSIIPVRGGNDVRNAKIAAVRWNVYRERFATSHEIDDWFEQQRFEGIAVVCGRLSQLVVLDFDDAHAYERFAQQFPTLTETYTIQSATRQTPHLYWRTRFTTHGANVHGGELRGEGQYVVTAPTHIGKRQYTVCNDDTTIREISKQELQAALAFLKPQRQINSAASSECTQDITSLYRESAPLDGRNNALYKASQQAKQSGWSLADITTTLTPIHVKQKAAGQHKPESIKQREQEALKTIESAFKHSTKTHKTTTKGLPNTIREKLIETQKTAITARLLEALYKEDIKEFTEAEATSTAQAYGIGRYSVLQALNGKLAKIHATSIFPIVIEKNMLCSGTEGVKKIGRRPKVYRLPDHEYLYDLLDVPRSSSDALNADDLRSGKRYRMALHREMLERRPGEYARGWMASRLGTSVRTVQRYNRELKVQSTPVYAYTRFDWDGIDGLPLCDERQRVTPGRWLEDAAGKRYPALRALAYKLLKQNAAPVYVRRLPNHYQLSGVSIEAIWRCLECGARGSKMPDQCHCHSNSIAVPNRAGQSREVVHIRECIHCGQMCFDDKLVCSTCRRKRDQPVSRITFDKDGKPRFPIRYNKTLLTSKNILTLLPDDWQRSCEFELDDPRYKAWLQTPDGKRYPTVQGLAFRLVKRYGEVFLVQRDNSTEMLYNLGMNLLSIGARKMGNHFLRRAGLRQ